MADQTYQAIVRFVRHVRRRWRVLLLIEGLLTTAAVVLGVLLLSFIADNVFHLAVPVRVTALLVLILAGATAFLWFVVRRGLRPISEDRAALAIEAEYPEIENRLINSIQLGRSTRYCNEIADAVIAQTEERLRSTRLEWAISAWPVWRIGLLVMVAVLTTVAYSLSFPTYFRNAAARMVTFKDAPLPLTRISLTIEPADVSVFIGDDVTVHAVPVGVRFIEQVTIQVRFDNAHPGAGAHLLDEMAFDGRAFVFLIPHVQGDGRYRVLAGDFKSPWYTITTRQPLEVERLDLVLTYPEYLRLAQPELIEGLGERTTILQDTVARLLVHVNHPATAGTLRLDSTKRPLNPESDQRFSADFTVRQDVTLDVSLTGADGISLRHPVRCRLVCIDDQPPEGRLLEPETDSVSSPDATLTLLVKATDDVGLDAVVLTLVHDAEPIELQRWTFNASPVERFDALQRLAIESHEWQPADFLDVGDRATVRLTVRDLKGQEVASDVLRFHLISPGQAERLEAKRRETIVARLRALLDTQRQARAIVAAANEASETAPARVLQFKIDEASGALVELITTTDNTTYDFIATALMALRANEFVRAVKALDAYAAAPGVVTQTAVLDIQDIIIEKLEALLATPDEEAPVEDAVVATESPVEPNTEQLKMARELKEILDTFIDEQRRVIEALEHLRHLQPEDFTAEDLARQERLRIIEDQWARFLEEKSTELDKVPEQIFSDPTLLKELRTIYEEIDLAVDELSKPGARIDVTEQQVAEGLELASELTHELERWLTAESDKLSWNLEEPSEPTDVPYAELPNELEDIIGDLIREEEELAEEMEDVSSSWTDSIDAGAGWDAMDGPISNMSAKGVTGNVLPNSTEIGGRSGEGRQGKAHGEHVGDTAVGKGGRRTPTRNTNDPYENATVDDQMEQPTGGATGGGKRSGAGGEGLPGHVPPDLQVRMGRLTGKQADLIVKGERLLHQLATMGYNAEKLRVALDLMRSLHYRTETYRSTDLVAAHREIVDELKTSRELFRHEVRTRREQDAVVPPKIRRVLDDTMATEFPEYYGDLLQEYYKAISE